MKNTLFCLIAGALALGLARPLAAQDDSQQDDWEASRRKMQEQFQQGQEDMTKTYTNGAREQAEEYQKMTAEQARIYDGMLKQMAAEREALRKRVVQQWTDFRESDTKHWVDYSAKSDTRSQVDFEKGKVEVEVLVPMEQVAPGKKAVTFSQLDAKEQGKLKALAEEKLQAQTKKTLAQKPEAKEPEVLKDQLQGADGKPVTEKNADRFVKEVLAPQMKVEEKPVVAQDGKPRLKVTVTVPMVPDHLKIRAKRYESQIAAAAKLNDLDPALVYAIVHTESEFNPMAKSQAPAFGLMQLMIPYGAKEAYKYVYKQDKVLTPEYLFDPDNNIKLGTAYMHLIMSRHYGKVKDPENRLNLSIAAYNCGSGAVNRTVLAGRSADSMSPTELLGQIKSKAPKETQAYVPRVRQRMELYRSL
ncbi:MAG: murein transglycosylase domain-containing protein [Elusimicrobia bacterium]|nr:murein transglycosylase domain-containing protein [Elusimicrobiota bacterium]